MLVFHEPFLSSIDREFEWKSNVQPILQYVRTELENAKYDHSFVFWLPAKEGLSRRSVDQDSGKGVSEQYNQDSIVVVWGPFEGSYMVYKNLATPDTRHIYFGRLFRARSSDKNRVFDKQRGGVLLLRHVSASSVGIQVEPGLERQKPTLYRRGSDATLFLTHVTQEVEARRYLVPDTAFRVLDECSQTTSSPQSGFAAPGAIEQNTCSLPRQASSSIIASSAARNSIPWDVWQPIDRVLKRISAAFERRTMTKRIVVRRPMAQFWTNTKGVVAVAIASV